MSVAHPDEGIALLLDMLETLRGATRRAIGELEPAALAWQPDPEANGIGVTVWHYSRWLDIIATRALGGGEATDELWFVNGWATRVGYDPRGLGAGGLGALTGYTLSEALAVPALPAADLLAYLDAACDALAARLRAMTSAALRGPAPGLREPGEEPQSGRDWVLNILLGGLGHLGELRAIRALYERAAA